MTFENIIVETHGAVGLIRLNRPKALNALSSPLMKDLSDAIEIFESDAGIRAIVLTGSERAFAAGADIKEMVTQDHIDTYVPNYIVGSWQRTARCRKPVIAAVAGYCLGGGCELAMMCDFIIAADNAKFGQPEITLGVIPGSGGTQRLTRLIGKAKAMDMVLTGRQMDAAEAERSGLVSRVVPADKLMEEALAVATKIAAMSLPVLMMAKESVGRAYESSLAEGLLFEGRTFQSIFSLKDKKEGMTAFIEKRAPVFKHR